MLNLSQLENGILATKKDLEHLEKKENSKILVNKAYKSVLIKAAITP